jgi:hypothetical protein
MRKTPASPSAESENARIPNRDPRKNDSAAVIAKEIDARSSLE